MSRQIDLTKPLSDEDRQYLVDRCRTNDLFVNDQHLSDDQDPLTPPGFPSQVPQAADVSPNAQSAAVGQTTPEAAPTGASPAAANVGSAASSADSSDDGTDEDVAPYTDEDAWPYSDLKEEISERQENYEDDKKIALNSSREDFISWLEADDAKKAN